MNNSPIVRKAKKTDTDTLIQFNIAMALETEQKYLEEDKIRAGVKSLFKKPEYGFYLVAEMDGQIAGSLMITKEWSDWRNGLFWWIQSVYVLPVYRRKGVYRSMYRKIHDMAKNRPGVCGFRLYVEKENKSAQATYSNLGMSETNYKMYEELFEE
ncbi:MAG TPA: GNAT family N-acetyltransferase [Balneolaceae bacterium]|nr:GNAT family N-acetyltransferase [Balneolaceae bacterium]